jgi:hypothetical protein
LRAIFTYIAANALPRKDKDMDVKRGPGSPRRDGQHHATKATSLLNVSTYPARRCANGLATFPFPLIANLSPAGKINVPSHLQRISFKKE